MARGRGRPALSDDEKARRRATKRDQAATAAMAKMPAQREKRDELRVQLKDLKEDAKEASSAVRTHQKSMAETYGFLPAAERINDILAKLNDTEFSTVIEQVALRQQEVERPFQLSMFHPQPGKGIAEDTGALFDKGSAGERVASERGDDPGRARRRSGGPPPAPPVDTGSLDTSPGGVAERAFQAALKPAGDNVVPIKPEPPIDEDEPDLRPRFLQQQDEPEVVAAPEPKKTRSRKGGNPTGTYRHVVTH